MRICTMALTAVSPTTPNNSVTESAAEDTPHLILELGVARSLCVQLLFDRGATWFAALLADQALDLRAEEDDGQSTNLKSSSRRQAGLAHSARPLSPLLCSLQNWSAQWLHLWDTSHELFARDSDSDTCAPIWTVFIDTSRSP